MKHPSPHIFDTTLEELQAWCVERGMQKFRAAQIMEWVYEKGVADPGAMSNLSKLDRETLAAHMTFISGAIVRRQSATDGVEKLLIEWNDRQTSDTTKQREIQAEEREAKASLSVLGAAAGDPSRQTECVMIPADDRRTACISSQIGCPVGCRFCASGLGGLDGNLSAGRIVEQVWLLQKLMRDEEAAANPASVAATPSAPARKPPRISNVVFMGMGEPLANYQPVVTAIRILLDDFGFGLSKRRVTVSTSGLVPFIERLKEDVDVALAVSLHAPNDVLRNELVPINRKYPIAELMEVCRRYTDGKNHKAHIVYEYVMLDGVNDSPAQAKELARLLGDMPAKVNLIPFNPFPQAGYRRSSSERIAAFADILRSRRIVCTTRKTRGDDIDAACGQLVGKVASKQKQRLSDVRVRTEPAA